MKIPNTETHQLPTLAVGARFCSRTHPTLFIAEEGQANQGDLALAFQMIEIAAGCGADGIEFQLGLAADLYVKQHEGFKIYQQREFSADSIKDLIAAAHEKGLLFQATCLSERLIPLVVDHDADMLVLNATDLNNPRMLDALSDCGKPFMLATLLGTLNEISWAVERVRSRGAEQFGLLQFSCNFFSFS